MLGLIKRGSFFGLCLILAFLMAFQGFVQILSFDAVAADGEVTLDANGNATLVKVAYVTDVAIGTREELEREGYTVTSRNVISEKSDTYLGYKTSSSPENAITDIAVMDMYGSYAKMDYERILAAEESGYKLYIDMLKSTIAEFRTGYTAGNKFSRLAYDNLNYIVRPEEDGTAEMKIGDYLLSTDLSTEEYIDITMRTTTVISSYIYNQLALAVADSSYSNTWLSRLIANGPLVFKDTKGNVITDAGALNEIYTKNYDSIYLQRAEKLLYSVQGFADSIESALQYYKDNPDFKINLTDAEMLAAIKRAADIFETTPGENEAVTEEDEKLEENIDASTALIYFGMYTKLDERNADGTPVYPFGTKANGKARSLAEFLLETGLTAITEDNNVDVLRTLFPFIVEQNGVTPMTRGQESAAYITGLVPAISYALCKDEDFSEVKTQAEKQGSVLISTNKGKAVSMWFGANREFYKENREGVYWTSALSRESVAQGNYGLLKKDLTVDTAEVDKLQKELNIMSIVSSAVSIVSSVAFIIGSKIGGLAGLAAIKVGFLAFAGKAVGVSVGACVACVTGVVFLVAALVLTILIIIWTILTKKKQKEAEEKAKEVTLTEMPKVIYDYCDNESQTGAAVRYVYVPKIGTDGPYNLLSGIKYQQWNVMYYTIDRNFGEPLTVQTFSDGTVTDPFVFKMNESFNNEEEYAPIHYFSTTTAVNFSERRLQTTTDTYNIYIHHPSPSSINTVEGGKYINTVIMCSNKDPNAARADIIRRGYKLLDVNLCNCYLGYGNLENNLGYYMYTYIGYTTTNNPNSALKDIRVAYAANLNPEFGEVYYGSASYTACGNCNELVLLQTSVDSAGTPILAGSLNVATSKSEIPAGCEGVVAFGGGTAFNFYDSATWCVSLLGEDNVDYAFNIYENNGTFLEKYLYFEPSVKYTSGEEYISGLAVFDGYEAAQYAQSAGWTLLSNISLKQTEQYLCYTKTYNPYRAIYDIRYYTGDPTSKSLRYNLYMGNSSAATEKIKSNGYCTIDTYVQRRKDVSYVMSYGEKYLRTRHVSVTHAFRCPELIYNPYGGNGKNVLVEFTYADDNTVYGRRECCATLYVTGKIVSEGKAVAPIKVSELYLSTSASYSSSEMTPVRDVRDWYSTEPACITYTGTVTRYEGKYEFYRDYNYYSRVPDCIKTDFTTELYLFIKRPDTTKKGNYVRSVTVINEIEGNKIIKVPVVDLEYGVEIVDLSSERYDYVVYEALQNGPGVLIPLELSSGFDLDAMNVGTGDIVPSPYAGCYYYSAEEMQDCHKGYEVFEEEGKTVKVVPYSNTKPQAYVWVSYTTLSTKAISDVYVHQSTVEPDNAPEQMVMYDGATGVLCGTGFADGTRTTVKDENGNDKKVKVYTYLYSVSGTGHQMTAFSVSENIMESGWQTVLSTDGTAPGYTRYYFHTKHYLKSTFKNYLKDIITVEADTFEQAQIELLNMGIRSCILYDMNPNDDKVLLIALVRETSKTNVTTGEPDAISGIYLNDAGRDATINKLIVGSDEYSILMKNVGGYPNDSIIQIYTTTSLGKSRELNRKSATYAGHFISDVMFWSDCNLYRLFIDGTSGITDKNAKNAVILNNISKYLDTLTAEQRAYLEPYLIDTSGKPIAWDLVTEADNRILYCNRHKLIFTGQETDYVYMFVNYTDGYVRDIAALNASIFGGSDGLILAVSVTSVLLLGAAAYVIAKKKGKKKTAVE